MADRLEWEGLLTWLAHELPAPVEQETARDGATILVGGDPGEVVVRVTATSATISEYAIEWQGPDEAVVRPVSFGTVRWRRMPEVHALAAAATLIRAARESRRSRYRLCAFCQRDTPPESLYDDETCDACARRQGAS